ncbi:DNA repair protein RAD52 [Giardia muris]|uniref:DNA repair protein RAD52 n=1 Tax=Giardia muris TaxID=5742 RepID=A0A4Z1SWP5_GIAMU|nr:DNA repair protein RAD52 [Giardia muris]|eukprot:TNJ30156.1 DNA repair protein RAD52 [Giardia muris]
MPGPWGQQEIADTQRRQAKDALSRVLGAEHLSTRPGPRGTTIPYLDGATAVRLANEAFRYDGWASELLSITCDFLEEQGHAWNVCYTAQIRVSLPNGCFHDGIGVGFVEGVRSKGEAIERAKKTAMTDGLKRALRYFGEGLGNTITLNSSKSKGTKQTSYEDLFETGYDVLPNCPNSHNPNHNINHIHTDETTEASVVMNSMRQGPTTAPVTPALSMEKSINPQAVTTPAEATHRMEPRLRLPASVTGTTPTTRPGSEKHVSFADAESIIQTSSTMTKGPFVSSKTSSTEPAAKTSIFRKQP